MSIIRGQLRLVAVKESLIRKRSREKMLRYAQLHKNWPENDFYYSIIQ